MLDCSKPPLIRDVLFGGVDRKVGEEGLDVGGGEIFDAVLEHGGLKDGQLSQDIITPLDHGVEGTSE